MALNPSGSSAFTAWGTTIGTAATSGTSTLYTTNASSISISNGDVFAIGSTEVIFRVDYVRIVDRISVVPDDQKPYYLKSRGRCLVGTKVTKGKYKSGKIYNSTESLNRFVPDQTKGPLKEEETDLDVSIERRVFQFLGAWVRVNL